MRHEVRAHLVVSFLGGAVGCFLLLWTGEARFARAVPWLMLTALLFFALGEWIKRHLDRFRDPEHRLSPRWILLFEFILMVYGGYFGAGVGIMLLAALAMAGEASIHRANAKKNLMVVALPVFVGASLGGYATVRVIRRIPARAVRTLVLLWAIVLTVYAFWKYG
jgi:uncharacterized membrane protein YfcA